MADNQNIREFALHELPLNPFRSLQAKRRTSTADGEHPGRCQAVWHIDCTGYDVQTPAYNFWLRTSLTRKARLFDLTLRTDPSHLRDSVGTGVPKS